MYEANADFFDFLFYIVLVTSFACVYLYIYILFYFLLSCMCFVVAWSCFASMQECGSFVYC